MNGYTKYLAGGALLATTALASGTVSAATISRDPVTATGTTAGTFAAASTYSLASNLFGGSGTVANSGSALTITALTITLKLGTSQSSQRSYWITLSGAEFQATGTGVTATKALLETSVSSSFTDVALISSGLTVYSDKIVIEPIVTQSSLVAIQVTGATIKNMQGLATVGGTVTLAGAVYNTAATTTFETATATTVFTSVASGSFQVTPTTVSASSGSSPPFAAFSEAGAKTASIGYFNLQNVTSQVGQALTTSSADAFISTAEIKITHGALSDPAVDSVTVYSAAGLVATKSAGQMVSGVATFTLNSTNSLRLVNGTNYTIEIGFKGTTAITGGSGTVTITPTAASTFGAFAAATGTLGSIGSGALVSQVNIFQNSQAQFSSFLRIANNGTTAGTYSIIVRNGSTGTALGTYTGGSVSPNGSIQLGASTLESGASVTASSTVPNYTLTVNANFAGYIQHLGFNGSALSDLSGFRKGGSTSIAAP